MYGTMCIMVVLEPIHNYCSDHSYSCGGPAVARSIVVVFISFVVVDCWITTISASKFNFTSPVLYFHFIRAKL
jgi:hypothetical protein